MWSSRLEQAKKEEGKVPPINFFSNAAVDAPFLVRQVIIRLLKVPTPQIIWEAEAG